MIRKLSAAAVFLLAAGTAAQAAPFCTDLGGSGFHFEFNFSIGGEFTESDRNEFDLKQLRRRGIDATRVERWNGCIRAFVREPGGGQHMEFYDPNTYERVY